jgi:hypothetical protein
MDIESEFNAKFQQMCNGIINNQYIFEITKLCGHGQFIPIFKRQTLIDIYKIISLHYDCKDIKQLFFINSCTNEKIYIPITHVITIQDFLFSHNSGSAQIIKPIYPIPYTVVYRIYFDDGHTHGNSPCEIKEFV